MDAQRERWNSVHVTCARTRVRRTCIEAVEELAQALDLLLGEAAAEVVEAENRLEHALWRRRARAVLNTVLLLSIREEPLAPLHVRRERKLAVLLAAVWAALPVRKRIGRPRALNLCQLRNGVGLFDLLRPRCALLHVNGQ